MLETTIFFCTFQHYQDDADGLCTRLAKPLEKKGGKFDFSVDPDSFKKGLMLVSRVALSHFVGFVAAVLFCLLKCLIRVQTATIK